MTARSDRGPGPRPSGRAEARFGGRLSLEDRETLLVHLIRVPGLFAQASGLLSAASFADADERHLKILWIALETAAAEARRRRTDVPFQYVALRRVVIRLCDELAASAADRRRLLRTPYGNAKRRPGLLHFACRVAAPGHDFGRDHGRQLLQELFTEREIHDRVAGVFGARDQVATNYLEILASFADSTRKLTTLGDNPVHSIRPAPGARVRVATWTPPGIDYFTTPIGGFAPRETYGLMGPYAGGKTSMALHVAIQAARYWRARHEADGTPLKHVYFFFYEGSLEQIQARVWAILGRVDKKILERVDTLDDPILTRTGDPVERRRDYERALSRAEGVDLAAFPGEVERIEEGLAHVECNFHLVQMSDAAGHDGVDEIAAILEDNVQASGRVPALVVVDYVGLVARRYIARHGGRHDLDREERRFIQEVTDQVNTQINNKYDCCTLLLHQLAAASNAKGATSRQHYSDAAGSKAFAENQDACVTIGVRDSLTGLTRIDYPKCRRTDKTGQFAIVRLRGEFGLFETDDEYTIRDSRFVLKDVADQVGGTLRAGPTLRRRPPDSEGLDTDTPFT